MPSRRGTDADGIDVERFRLPADLSVSSKASPRPPRHRKGEKFLRGPIPWPWIVRAARLRGGSLAMGLVLWRLVGVRNKRTVQLTAAEWADIFKSRKAAYRALNQLESAGLVSVARHRGRGPHVTLRDAKGEGGSNP